MPIARAMPSSPRRSAASITKIRKISRMPAAIENEPNVVKNAMNALPGLVGELERVLLRRRRPRGRAALERGCERRDDLVRERGAGDDRRRGSRRARALIWSSRPSSCCAVGERHEHARVRPSPVPS